MRNPVNIVFGANLLLCDDNDWPSSAPHSVSLSFSAIHFHANDGKLTYFLFHSTRSMKFCDCSVCRRQCYRRSPFKKFQFALLGDPFPVFMFCGYRCVPIQTMSRSCSADCDETQQLCLSPTPRRSSLLSLPLSVGTPPKFNPFTTSQNTEP